MPRDPPPGGAVSPEKTHPDGWYRIDRVIDGVGRIRKKSGRTLAMHRRVDALVTKLAEQGRLEELRLFKKKQNAGGISAMQLIDLDRRNAKADPSALKLAAPLWDTATALLAGAGPTQIRYRTSFKALETRGPLDALARVRDLARIDWVALEADWQHSPADWNRLRSAVSRFLTLQLGKAHPFRVELLKTFPKREEVERLVEMTPAEFAAIIAPAPGPVQDCFWTLVATGVRSLAEYQKLGREALGAHVVHVRLSKNASSHRDIPVDPKLWPYVLRAIPCAFTGPYLTRAWRALADAAGRPDLVLRDLRHCYGFWSIAAGVDVTVVRDAMGHKYLSTTQRYVKQRAKREHAAALAAYLVPEPKAKNRKRA